MVNGEKTTPTSRHFSTGHQVLFLVQARLGSTRLPGKVLKQILPDKSLLDCFIERLKLSKSATEIMVATTALPLDDGIAEFCDKRKIKCYRGSEDDVLTRFVEASSQSDCDVIVRLCADSPLHDAEIIDNCVNIFLNSINKIDYASNMHPESYPYGTAVEVFAKDVLQRLNRLSNTAELREHVTPMIYKSPELFRSTNVSCEQDFSHLRFAVDYPEDFDLVKKIFEHFQDTGIHFSWRETVALLQEHPELLEINASRNERLQGCKH